MKTLTLARKIGALASWFGPSLLGSGAENTIGSGATFQNTPTSPTTHEHSGDVRNPIRSVLDLVGNINGARLNYGGSVYRAVSAEDLDFLSHYLLESHSLIRQEVLTLDIFGGTHVEVLELPLTLEYLEQEVILVLQHPSPSDRQRIHELFEAKRNELSKKKAYLKWLLDDYRGLKQEQHPRD